MVGHPCPTFVLRFQKRGFFFLSALPLFLKKKFVSIPQQFTSYPHPPLYPPLDLPIGGEYYGDMKPKNKKSTRPPIEYIPIVSKQLRWVLCRQIAEYLYHSIATDKDLRKLFRDDLPKEEWFR